MATETISISGLDRNIFLVNNPIWVDVEAPSATVKIKVKVESLSFGTIVDQLSPIEIELYANPEGNGYFDLAPIAKSFLTRPKHPDNPVDDSAILTNYAKLQIQITAIEENGTLHSRLFTKDVIRGGKDSFKTNLNLASGQVLKRSAKLPNWAGWPNAKYYLNASNGISVTRSLTAEEVEQRRVVGCDNIMLRFMNQLGGYSFWLFEAYEINKKTKGQDVIRRRDKDFSTGIGVENTLKVRTRVPRRYYNLMLDLAESYDVYAYKLNGLNVAQATEVEAARGNWMPIYNNGNKADFPAFKDVENFEFEFDIITNKSPSLKW